MKERRPDRQGRTAAQKQKARPARRAFLKRINRAINEINYMTDHQISAICNRLVEVNK